MAETDLEKKISALGPTKQPQPKQSRSRFPHPANTTNSPVNDPSTRPDSLVDGPDNEPAQTENEHENHNPDQPGLALNLSGTKSGHDPVISPDQLPSILDVPTGWITNREARTHLQTLGIKLDDRRIRKLCAMQKLVSMKVLNEKNQEQYFIDPVSIERYVSDLQSNQNQEPPVDDEADIHKDAPRSSQPVDDIEDEDIPVSEDRLLKAEEELEAAKIDAAVYKQLTAQLRKERSADKRIIATQSEMIGRLDEQKTLLESQLRSLDKPIDISDQGIRHAAKNIENAFSEAEEI